MIINIHGLDSVGVNSKYEWLRHNMASHEIWSPDIDYRHSAPTEILDFLKSRIPEKKRDVYAVGSSMGGFFARIINQTYPDVTAILINPALAPFVGLRGQIDCKGYLELAARYAYSDDAAWRNLHVIAGDADERIDHGRVTMQMLPPDFDAIYWIKGGTHQMSVLAPEIDSILRKILRLEK
jgi:predicted esterase YcpF (UPF0227 family)